MRKLIRLTYFVCKKWEGKEKHYVWWSTESYQQKELQQKMGIHIALAILSYMYVFTFQQDGLIYCRRFTVLQTCKSFQIMKYYWVQFDYFLNPRTLFPTQESICMLEHFRSCVSQSLKILVKSLLKKFGVWCVIAANDLVQSTRPCVFTIISKHSLKCLNNMSLKSFMCCWLACTVSFWDTDDKK